MTTPLAKGAKGITWWEWGKVCYVHRNRSWGWSLVWTQQSIVGPKRRYPGGNGGITIRNG